MLPQSDTNCHGQLGSPEPKAPNVPRSSESPKSAKVPSPEG